MNLKECYEAFKGDYEDVMTRLPREASVIKFLRKFKDNTDYGEMLSAAEAGDYERVFAASHNLKGMAANLSISQFNKSVAEVCEAVRGGTPTVDITPLIEKSKADYEMTIAAIDQLED